jgi:geranylgeranyl diphosphate synthase, type II
MSDEQRTFYSRYLELRALVDERMRSVIDKTEPVSINDPARYIFEAGGKRIRPVLVLLACETAGGAVEDAVPAGIALEILHNFTLVHDDIMDNADQRRGRDTVHKRWDINTAILVGDDLIGYAYRSLLDTPRGDVRELVRVFTDGMIEVCEGQAYDKEFEQRSDVSLGDYLMMIQKKTGRLVSISVELGAIIAGAPEQVRAALVSYAEHIGRAFQIQDDLLDVIATQDEFGKIIGGDIIEGKRTYLLIKALDMARGADRDILLKVADRTHDDPRIVETVTALYRRLGILDDAREQIRIETDAAINALGVLPAGEGPDMLAWFAHMLLERKT